MAADLSNPMKPPSKLLSVVDMGTNSFKMVLVRAEPNGKFISIDRFKEPVVLGRGMNTNSSTISPEAQDRAITALQRFGHVLQTQRVEHSKFVATSAVREAVNKGEFLSKIEDETCLKVEILSGEEEARFIYMGVLQFLPVYEKTVLAIDIGGGSTEFVIGNKGKVILATSLKLGHVSLTDGFVRNGEIVNMRNHIRSVIHESGLVEKVREVGFEIAVGSSGTIRSIKKAVFQGFFRDLGNAVTTIGEFGREWKFSREELSGVVGKLCDANAGAVEKVRRVKFFKRRSEFILAGAVLLLEIFEILNIEEMEVSEYALGEGVIAEILASSSEEYDINVNARWRSVNKLATRFNNGKRMKSAALCVETAKELFKGLTKSVDHQNEYNVTLKEKDLEYLEAACLLHNIGLFIDKKGYHKHSYHIIKNGGHLHGYNAEELELIALLARYHRKKFPRSDHSSFHGFPEQVKANFRILCAILRISVAVQQVNSMTFQGLEIFNHESSFRLVFSELNDLSSISIDLTVIVEDLKAKLKPELDHFKEVVQKELLVVVTDRRHILCRYWRILARIISFSGY